MLIPAVAIDGSLASSHEWCSFDWGFPLLARDELTSQVLIGLGYGCTNNECGSKSMR
jgi:hypothetical protein